ncbi:MAG TPA: hypothetical protein DEO50_03150 [Erysipelotrichaceae bacterium]|nr:hypothetical protein [Erysipelotrichaceae bacterium]
MNIETLRYITQIIEEKSITKVSEKMHISQSALSQHIKTIESNLNTQIVNRTNRGITATESGEILYRHAKNIIDCYDALLEELQGSQDSLARIRIFANPLFSSYALPCTLFDLQEKFPAINLDMLVLPSHMVEQKIISGEGDIGFINGKPHDQSLLAKVVMKDPIHLVAQIDFPIDESIPLIQLQRIPLIMSSGRSVTRMNIDNALSLKGIDLSRLNIKYHMDTIESVKLSVMNKHGLSFLPYSSIKKELYLKQLKIIDVSEVEIYNEFYLILNKRFISKNSALNEVTLYLQEILADTLC